jgi:hypothetical protein
MRGKLDSFVLLIKQLTEPVLDPGGKFKLCQPGGQCEFKGTVDGIC